MSKKIKLLLFILCFVAAVLNGCAKNADSEVQGSDTAAAITNPRQIVASDNKTGRTIMWEAKVKQPYTLEYRLQGSKDIQAVQATDSSFTDKDSFIHTLRVLAVWCRAVLMNIASAQRRIKGVGTSCRRKTAQALLP